MRAPVRIACAALTLASLLGACTVGPDFQPPTVASPVAFGPEPAAGAKLTYGGEVDVLWWRNFHDPEFDSLVARLAAQNLDLQQATERVQQGRAQTRAVASQGLPQIGASAGYDRIRISPTGFLSLVQPSPTAQLEINNWQDSLTASWEIDLFGRVRRGVEAARAGVDVAAEARHGLVLMALSDLAEDYAQLRATQIREALARENLTLATQNLALVRNRFDHGVATTLDVANAASQRDSIAAQFPTLTANEARLINAIGFLLALPPRSLYAELTPPKGLPPLPPTVPLGLPGDLVRRRPDVRQAEAQLHVATAETGMAVASFYPDVTLNGSAGFDSLHFNQAFDWASRQFNAGPSVSLPIFSAGRLRAQLTLSRSEQKAAAIAFHETVLRAWQEVDDAMTAYAHIQVRRASTAAAVQQDELALDAARQRYARGAVDFLIVLAAQMNLVRDQNQLADDTTTTTTDLVNLYKALGGGWQISDASATQPTPAPRG